MTSPNSLNRERILEEEPTNGSDQHALFSEEGVLYPFPDELFWQDGDEGEWDGDGVPVWV